MCCGQTEAVCMSVSDSGTPVTACAFLSPALTAVCVQTVTQLVCVCTVCVCVF